MQKKRSNMTSRNDLGPKDRQWYRERAALDSPKPCLLRAKAMETAAYPLPLAGCIGRIRASFLESSSWSLRACG